MIEITLQCNGAKFDGSRLVADVLPRSGEIITVANGVDPQIRYRVTQIIHHFVGKDDKRVNTISLVVEQVI